MLRAELPVHRNRTLYILSDISPHPPRPVSVYGHLVCPGGGAAPYHYGALWDICSGERCQPVSLLLQRVTSGARSATEDDRRFVAKEYDRFMTTFTARSLATQRHRRIMLRSLFCHNDALRCYSCHERQSGSLAECETCPYRDCAESSARDGFFFGFCRLPHHGYKDDCGAG